MSINIHKSGWLVLFKGFRCQGRSSLICTEYLHVEVQVIQNIWYLSGNLSGGRYHLLQENSGFLSLDTLHKVAGKINGKIF